MESEEDERPVLILQPYGGHLEIAIHPTSRVLKADCGHYSWLSPQGEPYLDRGMRTMCMTCSDGEFGVTPERGAFLVEGALDSVRELAGEAALPAAHAFMRKRGIQEHE